MLSASIKSQVFNFLSKPQKADLIRYFTQLARKIQLSEVDRAIQDWIEDERFLCQQGTSFKSWLAEYLDDPLLAKDATRFLSFQIRYKSSQKIGKEAKEDLKAQQKARREKIKLQQWEKIPATPKQKGAVKAIVSLGGEKIDLANLTKAQAYTLIKKKNEAANKLHWKENLPQDSSGEERE